ncbi:acyl-CoA dehydrogenase [Streptomyces sp. ISL-43]|uniref:acyl-CoA dehydrogenase n=1 Tax=Streptomyces sp. ISL-43 TaxID=2819183 RepID=UPI0020350281|nr:acyl-CoA dehydrogenase [Streptomyces sp. ISL-43]
MTTVTNRADSSEAAVQERIARLEHEFGDLEDPGNPLGAEQFLAADDRGRLLPAAERLLDRFGLNAEFVPRELGGRLDRLDALSRVLRAVFRRDAALGLGYGLTSYMASVVVWADGTQDQRRDTAELLLGGGRMACAYPEPPQGNDFLANRLTARPDGGGFLLSGRKEALNSAASAQSLVLFAHTPGAARGELSAFLMPGPDSPGGANLGLLPRRRTVGIRGCVVQGLEFDGHHLDRELLIGAPGAGAQLAERAFPLTRSTGLSMALGCADTALRTTTAFARSHRSRSRASLHTARTRTALVDAFTDLLISDCVSLVTTRSVHLLPAESRLLGAVAKYQLPTVLNEAVYDLSIVLGAESYARSGSYGTFQKTARDLPMIGLGSAGTASSRAVIVAHLLRLGEVAVSADDEAPAPLFRPFDADLPDYRHEGPLPPARGDSLLASLLRSARHAAAAGGELGAALAESTAVLTEQLRVLLASCAELAGQPRGHPVSPRAYAMADRYALIVAGAACLGVWRHQDGSGFLADPAWAAMALTRIAGRLDKTAAKILPLGEEHLLAELLHRFDDARSYDLYSTAIG